MKTELYRSFEGKLDVGGEGYIIYNIGGGRLPDRTLQRMDTRPRNRSVFRQNSCRRGLRNKQRSPNFA